MIRPREQSRRAFLRRHEALETNLAAAIKPLLDAQRQAAVSRLRDMSWKSLDGLVDATLWQTEEGRRKLLLLLLLMGLRSVLEGAMDAVLIVRDAAPSLGLPPDIPPEVASAAQAESDAYVQRPDVLTLAGRYDDRLGDLVAAAAQRGLSVGEIADELESQDNRDMAEGFAKGLARTQATTWLNTGSWLYYQRLSEDGIVTGLEWVTMRDDLVRPTHREADYQVIAPGEMFVVGGYECRFPGDPNLPIGERINCRCVTSPVISP